MTLTGVRARHYWVSAAVVAALTLSGCSTFEVRLETQQVPTPTGQATTAQPTPAVTQTRPEATPTSTISPTPSETLTAPVPSATQDNQPTATATLSATAPRPTATRSPVPATITPTGGPAASGTPCQGWFFAPAPAECPAGPPEDWTGAAQRFERGFMLWIAVPDRFYVFLYDGSQYLVLPAPYQSSAGQPVTATPPAGLQAPVSGFGQVWRGELRVASANTDNLPQRLGWALETEQAFETEYQCRVAPTLADERCYLRSPDGRLLSLTPDGAWAAVIN